MAAGREGRAERLNERLRGAQRANVDESFNLDLGGLDIPGSTSPLAEEPSSSSRTGKQDSDAISAPAETPGLSVLRRSRRRESRDFPNSTDTPRKESPPRDIVGTTPGNQDVTPSQMTTARGTRLSTIARSAVSRRLDPIPDELETLPAPLYVRSALGTSSSPRERMSADLIEEVEESPPSAPGSGKRRRVLPLNNEVSNPSVRQLSVASPDGAFPASSSPSERRVRRSESGHTRRFSSSVSRLELLPEVDEITSAGPGRLPSKEPELPANQSGEENDEQMLPDSETNGPGTGQEDAPEEDAEDMMPEPEPEPRIESEQKGEQSSEEQEQTPQDKENEDVVMEEQEVERAEEHQVDGADGTKPSIRKRQRLQREVSPELGLASEDETRQAVQQPSVKKRRPGKVPPIVQKRPATRKRQEKAKSRAELRKQSQAQQAHAQEQQEQAKQAEEEQAEEAQEESVHEEARPKESKARRKRSPPGEDGGGAIEVTVQRFVHHKQRSQEEDGIDPLHSEIPFANRGGESVVDAFAQVCNEIITSTMAQLGEMASAAGDAAMKKECRIKMRAIEAYREELNSRLLQHIIHLNHWHSLRRRVRHVQKEKVALREEIIRIRNEREQVALRMDAVRIKHEADSKISKYCLDASTLMHDVDLAVEQGKDALELSSKEQKEAELANLELLVSRIMPEASSAHSAGGMLKQIKDFNALLERAAIALETR